MISSPWNISTEEFANIVRQLQFKYYKWDAFVAGKLKVLPESLIIEQNEYQEAVSICLRVSDILAKLESKIKQDFNLLLKLAIPPKVAKLIQREPVTNLQLARYDLFQTSTNAWMLSEFNEDVPGGFNEAVGSAELLKKYYHDYSFESCFSDRFIEAFDDVDGAIGLMYASGYSEDLQHMAILESLLQERGHKTFYCTPSQLTRRWGKTYVDKIRIGSLIRFYPAEWFGLLPNYRTWEKAISSIPMMNPLSRLIRQSKNLFALWNEENFLSTEDKDFINSVTPESIFFAHVKDRFQQFPKEDWVIKHAFGRMGDSVTMGSLVSDEEWKKTWEEAAKKPAEFTIQRKFNVSALHFQNSLMFPTLGVYLINNRFAGFYSRTAEKPFLTHEAYYVPTMVKIS